MEDVNDDLNERGIGEFLPPVFFQSCPISALDFHQTFTHSFHSAARFPPEFYQVLNTGVPLNGITLEIRSKMTNR